MVTKHPADAFAHELRRGTVVLATLSRLAHPQYGYALRQALAAHGMDIEEGTLYPLLRRLEARGLLESEWRVEGGGPRRRYYRRSAEGNRRYRELVATWRAMRTAVDDLIRTEGAEPCKPTT
ncbi:MAG: PadR family transcriptional regulator [Acidobacteriota bacterium]